MCAPDRGLVIKVGILGVVITPKEGSVVSHAVAKASPHAEVSSTGARPDLELVSTLVAVGRRLILVDRRKKWVSMLATTRVE